MNVSPYLILDGTCEAAFAFYAKTLGAKIVTTKKFRDVPEACEGIPESALDRTMHVALQIGDTVLMGSDSHPMFPYEGIKGASVSVSVDDAAEAERVFAALAKGGNVQMPMGETFWSVRFGMCVDQFGVPWMVNCDKPPA